MEQKLEQLKGHLIVSCQALPHEPLHSSFIMGRMAKAAAEGEMCIRDRNYSFVTKHFEGSADG